MCKAHALGDIQRLAGYHVDPASKSALEYSRDSQAPRLFMPDSTRAGRWVGCRSLQQALDNLAKRSNAEPVEADWIPVDEVDEERLSLFGGSEVEEPLGLATEGILAVKKIRDAASELQSSASEGNSVDDNEEDEHQLEVAGKAISGLVAGAGAHTRVFKNLPPYGWWCKRT